MTLYATGRRRCLVVLGAGTWTALFGLTVMAYWPGVPAYDTVYQFKEVVTGQITDWHPPIMARLWQALTPISEGTGPMLLLQTGLYCAGFVLLIGSLINQARGTSALAVAAIGIFPLFVGWQMVVLKDQQMLGALVCATGLAAPFDGTRQMPRWSKIAIVTLLLYATFLRTNSAFATVPLGVLLLIPSINFRRLLGLLLGLIPSFILITGLMNIFLFGAVATDRPKSQALFDLAGIAARVTDPRPFTHSERQVIVSRNCANPFFWDPLEIDPQCTAAANRVRAMSGRELYAEFASAVLRHPIAYAEHRLSHWNLSQRFWSPVGLINSSPPLREQPNNMGLRGPRGAPATLHQSVASVGADLFTGWPIFWTCLATLLYPIAIVRRSEGGEFLPIALLTSALSLEASFLAVSIAADLRYHLWPMVASAIALALLINKNSTVRIIPVLILIVICFVGTVARHVLDPAPADYQSTLTAAL